VVIRDREHGECKLRVRQTSKQADGALRKCTLGVCHFVMVYFVGGPCRLPRREVHGAEAGSQEDTESGRGKEKEGDVGYFPVSEETDVPVLRVSELR
jgi:hypothetical protein